MPSTDLINSKTIALYLATDISARRGHTRIWLWIPVWLNSNPKFTLWSHGISQPTARWLARKGRKMALSLSAKIARRPELSTGRIIHSMHTNWHIAKQKRCWSISLRTGEIVVGIKTNYTHSNEVHIQGSAKRWSPGLVEFYYCSCLHHYCLSLPAAFKQPGDNLLAEPCMPLSWVILSVCNIHTASISLSWSPQKWKWNETHWSHLSVLRLAAGLDAGQVDAGEPAESLAEEQHAVGQLDRRLVKHVAHPVDLSTLQAHHSQIESSGQNGFCNGNQSKIVPTFQR